jgi:hypothetical protein
LTSEQVVATVASRKSGDNAATALIASSLHHAASELCPGGVEELLAIPSPKCRRYRDDMTAQVMFFDGVIGEDVPMVELGLPTRVDRVGPLLAGRAKL